MKRFLTIVIKSGLTFALLIFCVGFMLPEQHVIPVKGATQNDWNPKSFWYFPWGRSRVHKGIDIFAKEATPVLASTGGLVLHSGNISMGGNVVYVLGANWRFHYYAHLKDSNVKSFTFVNAGQEIGRVGSPGNAKGKSPHLHYSIRSLFPRVWTYDPEQKSSWSRLFYLDPAKFIIANNDSSQH